MTWILSICPTLIWGICSTVMYREYPNEDSCYRAKAALVADAKEKPAWSVCSPKETTQVKP